MLQLQPDGFLHVAIPEDAGGGIVLPHLVVEPRQDAGSALAKNGRISRSVARIGSSISSKSRRMAFQSRVIGGSSAG